jgi:hypothetical protein
MKISSKGLRLAAAAFALLGLFESPAWADRVSGTLTSTYVIVEDTDLIGDVTCNTANACFSFGAPGVELRLNGFTITGRGDPVTGCGGAATGTESGVSTNGMSNVAVRGPGLVQRFRGDGIMVTGSTDSRIESLTISTNCLSGIRVLGNSFSTLIQGNTSVRNGNGAASCGGI